MKKQKWMVDTVRNAIYRGYDIRIADDSHRQGYDPRIGSVALVSDLEVAKEIVAAYNKADTK